MSRTFVVIATASMLALVGCSSNVGDEQQSASARADGAVETGDDENARLRFMLPEGGGREEGFSAIIEAYGEIQPNVDVTIEAVPFGDYEQVLSVQQASDNPPDVALIEGYSVASMAHAGLLESLDDLFSEQDLEDFLESMTEIVIVDGSLYAVPFFESTFGLFYNVDLFADAGVGVPDSLTSAWSWDEMVEAVSDVVEHHRGEGDEIAGVMFLNPPPNNLAYTLNFVRSNAAPGTDAWRALAPDGTSVAGYLDAPELIEGLHRWQELFTSGLAPTADIPDAFGSGLAATQVAFPGWGGVMDAAFPDLNWDVAPLPYMSHPLVHTGHFTPAVSAGGANVDAAKSFVEFVGSVEGFRAYASAATELPARRSLLESVPELSEGHMRVFRDQLLEWGTARPSGVGYPIYAREVGEMMADIALGADVEETVARTVSELDRQLATLR